MSTEGRGGILSVAFMEPKRVAVLLNVSVWTIYRRIADGELSAIRVGRQWRVTEDSVRRRLAPVAEEAA